MGGEHDQLARNRADDTTAVDDQPAVSADKRGADGRAADAAVRRMAQSARLDPQVERAITVARAIELVLLGERDENALTDALFWGEHPELKGQKLQSGSPEAKEWLALRDQVARVALRSAPPKQAAAQAPAHDATAKPAAPVASQNQPAPQGAHAQTPAAPGGSHHYFTQYANTYDDNDSAWAGNAGGNTCNMTSLSMGLVDIAGGDEDRVRHAIADKLRTSDLKPGARVTAGGKSVPLTTVLGDDALLAKVSIGDLLIALTAALGHKWEGATKGASKIAEVARATGLSTGKAKGQSLATEKGRTYAREALAKGERLVLTTPNHFIYLVDVRDDGVVVHDPAGARLSPSAHDPKFLWPGSVSDQRKRWLNLVAQAPEVAKRRVSTNPAAQAVVERLIAASKLTGQAHEEELAKLAKDHEHVEMGQLNFYGPEDYKSFELSVAVELGG